MTFRIKFSIGDLQVTHLNRPFCLLQVFAYQIKSYLLLLDPSPKDLFYYFNFMMKRIIHRI